MPTLQAEMNELFLRSAAMNERLAEMLAEVEKIALLADSIGLRVCRERPELIPIVGPALESVQASLDQLRLIKVAK